MTICIYAGKLPENAYCMTCSLLYEVCSPVCGPDGLALVHECSIEYFCPACPVQCGNKELINL